MKIKVSDIVKATGGSLITGSPDTVVSSFFTDSRNAAENGMFVPMFGDKVDSHRFIKDVLNTPDTSSFTMIDLTENIDYSTSQSQAIVRVPDTLLALQQSAAYYRDQFDIPIIGVTGSVGKTSAKEMIALALSPMLNTLKTSGNRNSQTGVPLTICRLEKEHGAAVVEMGISMPGEMERLAKVVKPNFAVVTNIGTSHIEFLKTRENIMAEKLHIADFLSDKGILFVNGDDNLLASLKRPGLVSFGVSEHCDFRGTSITQSPAGTQFICEYPGGKLSVSLPVLGIHNVRNALVSLAAAYSLGADIELAAKELAVYSPPAMRQQVLHLKNDITLIDDSYNASPESMHGALDILSSISGNSRSIAVLGDMLELGRRSETSHFEIGEYAFKTGVSQLFAVGNFAEDMCKGFGSNCICLPDANTAADSVISFIKPGDTVLVKASRGVGLDKLSRHLIDIY